jgi:molecular chaperone GrpE
MSLAKLRTRKTYTPEEYLEFEREAEVRHEYLDGEIYEMAGESLSHSRVCVNLAIAASEKDSSFEHLLVGVKGTARSFEQALMSVGVEPVETTGADFNPELHEAVEMVETDADGDGKIVGEFARGYKLGERLLRPARVQVGRGRAQTAGE